jgi:hypothetical protein
MNLVRKMAMVGMIAGAALLPRVVNAQNGYAFPNNPLTKDIIRPGVIYDGNGESQTAVVAPGIMIAIPNDKHRQEVPQQSYGQQGKTPQFGHLVLWQDRNGNNNLDAGEMVDGQPKIGEWYKVSLHLRNAGGVTVNVEVSEHPDDPIVAANDNTILTKEIRFRKPTLVRFSILDGYSRRLFTPTK